MIVGRKEDEAGEKWIRAKDNFDFIRIAQKIKAEPNASAFINATYAGLWCLTLFLGFFFFRCRGCFTSSQRCDLFMTAAITVAATVTDTIIATMTCTMTVSVTVSMAIPMT